MSLHQRLGPDTSDANTDRTAWDDYPRWGNCEACGKHGPVTRHHVVHRQHVRNWHGDEWDPRNSMLVGDKFGRCTCHASHHLASRRIPLAKVPESALAFAVDLMGEHAAAAYFKRFYAA